jgi:ketosteroid isomerase-like protein
MGVATSDRLAAAPAAYFDAVDAKDLDGTLAFFADDASFTVQSAGLTFTGVSEIAGMFTTFFGDYSTIRHRITNLVVDEGAARAATEQTCPHVRADGTPETVTTCNTFAFGPGGLFTRVVVWIDAASPLK